MIYVGLAIYSVVFNLIWLIRRQNRGVSGASVDGRKYRQDGLSPEIFRHEGLPPFAVSQLFSVSVFHLPQQRRYETSLQEMAIRGKHRLQAHFSHYHHARAIHK